MSTQYTTRASRYFVPMIIIGSLFFIFGFVTWLNGALIPFLEVALELSQLQALFVTFAFYIAYTVMALPMAAVLKRTGYRKGMAIGLVIMTLGTLVFIPAAYTRLFPLFLFGLFITGTGTTLLQTASNPYVVRLGPHETAAVRMGVMGILNKAAGIVGPLVFTLLVLGGMPSKSHSELALLDMAAREEYLDQMALGLVVPYIAMAVLLMLWAAAVIFSPLPEVDDEPTPLEDSPQGGDDKWGILRFPQAVLGAVAIFVYVGVEVIAADTIGLYGNRVGVEHFGVLTSYTMSFMLIGYVLGMLAIPRVISQVQALLLSAVLGALFCVGTITASNESHAIASILFGWSGIATVPNSVMFLALAGFAHALVWPAVWPLALADLGKHTPSGSALLVIGISGGAVLPLLYGYLSESSGSAQSAYWMMLPCYLFLLFYALKGHKLRSWSGVSSAHNP